MKVRVEDAGPCRKVVHISAPPETVAAEHAAILSGFAKFARVPGFRPGRAPASVVESRYAKGIEEEAKERLVPRLYREALKEKGIVPVAIVDVGDVAIRREDGMSFNVTIDVSPDFKLPKYRKIPLKTERIEVTEQDIDGAVRRLLDNFAKFDDVTGRTAVQKGDLACIEYKGTCEGKPMGEIQSDVAGLGEGRDFWVYVEEPEFLPGFNAGLIGIGLGETRDIHVKFPSDFRLPKVAGKDAVYSVTVKAIREKKVPQMDAEVLKRLGVDSEAVLRANIRANLASLNEQKQRDRMKDEIARFLLKNCDFEVPKSIVGKEMELTLRNILRGIALQGGTEKQIDEQKDEILKVAQVSSTEKVKLYYVLSRIADEEKVAVEESEVAEQIGALAKRHETTPERLRADLEKVNGIERLRSDIRAEKTLNLLLDYARIKE